jgi:hypothetical protein
MTIRNLQQQFNLLVGAWRSERLAWAHHCRQGNGAFASISQDRMKSLGIRAVNIQQQIADQLNS